MRWQSFTDVALDCDSTLTAVEGIDVLAARLGKEEEVAALTHAAMDGAVDLADVYGARLAMLNPTRREVLSIKNDYKANVVTEAREVIGALRALSIDPWIISGGLLEPVVEFGIWLGVDPARVRAVGIDFDPLAGQWWASTSGDARYLEYTRGHLTGTTGKGDVIAANITGKRKMMVGDGMSDLRAGDAVELFVAYAGVVRRSAVVRAAPVVISSPTLAPLLALAAGPMGVLRLFDSDHHAVALSCFAALEDGGVEFNDPQLGAAFTAALQDAQKER